MTVSPWQGSFGFSNPDGKVLGSTSKHWPRETPEEAVRRGAWDVLCNEKPHYSVDQPLEGF